MYSLSKRFQTKTFDGYTLSAKLQEVAHLGPIQEAVFYLNHLKTYAWLALTSFIEDILEDQLLFENDLLDLGEDDDPIQTFHATLLELSRLTHGSTGGNGGKLFFQGLLRFIQNGKYDGDDPLVMAFVRWHDLLNHSFCLDKSLKIPKGIPKSVEELAGEMDTAFAALVIGRVGQLGAKVLKLDSSFAFDIQLIDLDSLSAAEKFYRLNLLLPIESRFRFCPTASASDSFVTLTAETLNTMLKLKIDLDTKGLVMKTLFKENSFGRNRKIGLLSTSVAFDVVGTLGLDDETIADMQAELIESNRKDPRYLFRQTIKTNGQEVQIHVLDMQSPKQRENSVKSTDSILQQAQVVSKKAKRDKGYLPPAVQNKINDYTLCGIDFGQAYFAAFIEIPATRTETVIHAQLSFKMKALQQPTRSYAYWQKQEKEKFGVPLIDPEVDPNETLVHTENQTRTNPLRDPYLPLELNDIFELERALERHSDESWADYLTRFKVIHPLVSKFYNSKAMKKRKNYLKKALKGEAYLAIDKLLKGCGTSSGVDRKAPAFKPVIFLIGDSDIGTGTWTSFETICVNRLRALGHIVLLRWEHNTSQKCPKIGCGHQQMEYQGVGIRVKYCRKCGIFYHRDVVAGENNIFLFRFELEHGYRPYEYSTLKQQADWGKIITLMRPGPDKIRPQVATAYEGDEEPEPDTVPIFKGLYLQVNI